MDGEATPSQLAALLVALRMRGETTAELAGFTVAMRERVTQVDAPAGAIDVVGTGGDRSGTFNISTTAALVVAAAGVPVAKHGNRAMTSRSGSADVLDALGIRTDHDAESAAAALRSDGFAFLFAPGFHPAMRFAGPTRREIGVRTAFNLIGPLTNPAGVARLIVGVADPVAADRIAEVLEMLGQERALVVHGAGVDELPLDGTGVIHDVSPTAIEVSEVGLDRIRSLGLADAPTQCPGRGHPGRERRPARGRPGRSAGTAARCRAAQCRRGIRRGRPGDEPGRRGQAGRGHDRRRRPGRAAGPAEGRRALRGLIRRALRGPSAGPAASAGPSGGVPA